MKKVFSILLSGITLASCNMRQPLVIGHRGAMGHETENTLASVQKAMDLGVDMIEIDVFKIQSGEIVVFHDETVDELTNGPGKIEEYNIFDLSKLIVNGGHKIPMLQDVLKLIDNKVALNIELKGDKTADKVNYIMNYYIEKKGWSPENFIISSFKWDELREMRKLNPTVQIAVLTEDNPVDAIPVAKEVNAVAINPYYKNLDMESAKKIRKAGFKINVWTVNEDFDIDAMKKIGVDGIITNYPERVR
ncbi:glycerophosphodiester phosphodiesterase [Maribacter sp. 4G9]|uniref:glycerophosphodiester phosphodiesterase n=1 Tax=Maribacter sp. 4G9 TaxID=1889777 RepID=UPI000C15BFEF|nr:glycerophosphodiester phosphodiesterase family protein [Maribacter sp. 4G9]PIB38244.1 glycerophosphodiester phosphodiesterase [Maribacter sp. 4G9]